MKYSHIILDGLFDITKGIKENTEIINSKGYPISIDTVKRYCKEKGITYYNKHKGDGN